MDNENFVKNYKKPLTDTKKNLAIIQEKSNYDKYKLLIGSSILLVMSAFSERIFENKLEHIGKYLNTLFSFTGLLGIIASFHKYNKEEEIKKQINILEDIESKMNKQMIDTTPTEYNKKDTFTSLVMESKKKKLVSAFKTI